MMSVDFRGPILTTRRSASWVAIRIGRPSRTLNHGMGNSERFLIRIVTVAVSL